MNFNRSMIFPLLFLVTGCLFIGFLIGTSPIFDVGSPARVGAPASRGEIHQQQLTFAFIALIAATIGAWLIHATVQHMNNRDDNRKRALGEPQSRGPISSRVAMGIVVLLYPLSFGPVCWIATWCGFGGKYVNGIYAPIVQLAVDHPSTLRRPIMSYANLGAARLVLLNSVQSVIEL